MEAELSHTTLILWAIGIQAILLVLILVFWLSRRTVQEKNAKVHRESFFIRNRKVFSVGGSVLLAITIVITTAYFFLFPDEEKHFPSNVRGLEMRGSSDSSQSESENPPGYGETAGSGGWIAPPLGERGSRIREAVRKSMRGKNLSETKGRIPGDPVLHSYLSLINIWVADQDIFGDNLGKTSALFFDVLVNDYGFTGKKSDVEEAISQALFLKKDKGISYLNCGRKAKAIWGQNTARIDGTRQTLNCFTIQSSWSGRYFVHCSPQGQAASFLEAHKAVFLFFGGVFETIFYKNITNQHLKDVLQAEGLTQKVFEQFCLDCGFTPECPDNHQIPSKEIFSNIPDDLFPKTITSDLQATTLRGLNKNLQKACDLAGKDLFPDSKQTVNERFEQEKICLIPFH